ncbi:MAG: GyrI-like domain-containing protein [Lachnospiraceae bacterium]
MNRNCDNHRWLLTGICRERISYEIPAVPMAACIFHNGSYDTLHKSYGVLLQHIEEKGYEICGNIRESYIDGVWNKESENDLLTEIQIPVKQV